MRAVYHYHQGNTLPFKMLLKTYEKCKRKNKIYYFYCCQDISKKNKLPLRPFTGHTCSSIFLRGTETQDIYIPETYLNDLNNRGNVFTNVFEELYKINKPDLSSSKFYEFE